MKKLLSVKKAAVLRKKTNLRPVLRNATRWSSTYEMIKRYIALRPFIDWADPELAVLAPSAQENLFLETVLKDLEKLDSVTKKLQNDQVDILDVRVLFDDVITQYPDLEQYLSPGAQIVHSFGFEKTLVKILMGEEAILNSEELDLVRFFKVGGDSDTVAAEIENYADSVLAAKKTKLGKMYGYSVKWIPPTSNIVERLFSKAKLTLGSLRTSLSPMHLESILFLFVNKMYWNVYTVEKLI